MKVLQVSVVLVLVFLTLGAYHNANYALALLLAGFVQVSALYLVLFHSKEKIWAKRIFLTTYTIIFLVVWLLHWKN